MGLNSGSSKSHKTLVRAQKFTGSSISRLNCKHSIIKAVLLGIIPSFVFAILQQPVQLCLKKVLSTTPASCKQ